MRKAAVIALLLLASPASAQKAPPAPLSDSAQAMIGTWELSNAERSRTCTANFKNARAGAGYRVEFGRDCEALFPVIATVGAWVFPEGDLLRLLDKDGQTVTEFSEVEDGIFEAPTPGVGVLFLQNAAAAARKPDAEPEPERVEEPAAK